MPVPCMTDCNIARQMDALSQLISINKQPSLKTCIFDLQALCRRGSASLLALFQLSASANVYKGL